MLMVLMRCIIFPLLPHFLLASVEEPHHTSAFIGAPNHLDTLITYSSFSTDHFWNSDGKKLPAYNEFKQHCYLLYSEYAVNHSHSFFINGGYSSVIESMNGRCNAFRDIEVGWKYGLCERDESAITIECLSAVPTGIKKSSIRYGKFAFQASLLYSRLFCIGPLPAWTDMGAGYRVYQGFPSDEVRTFVSFGCQPAACLGFIATGELECGGGNGDSEHNLNNITYHPNRRLFKAKIECIFKLIEALSISIGAYQHFWGQNVGTGGGFFCGTWLDF